MTTTYESNLYRWVSAAAIKEAQQSGKPCCDCCKPYGAPGFVVNAGQWVQCFQCNPTAKSHKATYRHY